MPVIAIWGLALTPMKILNLVLLAIALLGMWQWLKSRLHPVAALILIALVGISPFHWQARDHILSDTPFLTFSVIFFLCYDHFVKKPGWRMGVVLGVLLAFIYMLRSAGLFLIATFAVHIVIASPLVRRWGLLALGSCALLVLIHNSLVPTGSYFTMMELSQSHADPIKQFYTGFSPYVQSFGEFLLVDYPNLYASLGKIAIALLVVCMAAGLAQVRKWTLLETYICVHFAALAFFPGFQGFRYLVGFFPFLLYYGFDFVSRIPIRWVRISVITGMIVILILHINRYYVENFRRDIPGGIQEPGAQAMFSYIRDNTPADAVIIAEKPRAVSLYTDRPGTVYPSGMYLDRWMNWLTEANVTYAVKMAWDKEIGYRYWGNDIDNHPEIFELLFEKDAFQVWRVHQDSIPVK
jgi:hypothetical protein